ncbi:MAG: hypothetical protein Q7S22_07220 [Candidatus Micrarchaeota archaeon]|nr:hypothetical protein [Candidatus Micrarchaeota archaeon]
MSMSQLKTYARLEKTRPREKHFLHQIGELVVLLEDPVRTALGLEKRTGVNLPFNQFLKFSGRSGSGETLQIYVDVVDKNASGGGTLTKKRFLTCADQPWSEGHVFRLPVEGFWSEMSAIITDTTSITQAVVYKFTTYQGLLRSLGFFPNYDGQVASSIIQSGTILSGGVGATIKFNQDPAIFNVDTVRDLVCDVIALLQLGYVLHTDTNPKVGVLALRLQEALASSKSGQDRREEIIRFLDSGVRELQ